MSSKNPWDAEYEFKSWAPNGWKSIQSRAPANTPGKEAIGETSALLQEGNQAAFDLYELFRASISCQSQEEENKRQPRPKYERAAYALQTINHFMKANDKHPPQMGGGGGRSGDAAAGRSCSSTAQEQFSNSDFATAEKQVELLKLY